MKKLLLMLLVCLVSFSSFAADKIELSFLVGSNGHDVTAAKRAAEMYMEKKSKRQSEGHCRTKEYYRFTWVALTKFRSEKSRY